MTQTHERSAVRTQSDNATAEPVNLLKRVGSTTYIVAIHFSDDKNAEKPEDKAFRLIESEVRKLA
jgi:FMN phosphatase YigB (HAD superfamily)